MNPVATLRRGQLTNTFGIGSIVDATEISVMVAGQDFWDVAGMEIIHEPRLEHRLKVTEFRQPRPVVKMGAAETHPSVPAVRFPEWHSCPKCHRLARLEHFGDDSTSECRTCAERLVPARFVVACDAGHIDDFPWWYWIRRGGCTCRRPELQISSTGLTSTLRGIVITCVNKGCGRTSDLGDVFNPGALAGCRCPGRRPWLKNSVADCARSPVALQRGASNVYFSFAESAISIPPLSSKAHKAIARNWHILRTASADEIAAIMKATARGTTFSADDLRDAYLYRKNLQESAGELDIAYEEYAVLGESCAGADGSDFAARRVSPSAGSGAAFDRIVAVDRLRVVTALTGFSRISPNAPAPGEVMLATARQDWLPATEVQGEGIFIRFSEHEIAAWKTRAGKGLEDAVAAVERRRAQVAAGGFRTRAETVTAEFLLIHTFAHLLIRALTLDCGYSSSALRERLYVRPAGGPQPGMHGLLIYTAAADSEGSLGGLVRQAEPHLLGPLLEGMLEAARWCSNDPLCGESAGQGMHSLNLAACHSCALVPETACEHFNSYLDRAVVVGLGADASLAYFAP